MTRESGQNIVNFRQAKKRAARTSKDALAQENRVKFGRTKAQKLADKTAASKLTRHIDDHKREP